jgi:squalene-hopene/tetraprenyl-beta-curcumene cyclase
VLKALSRRASAAVFTVMFVTGAACHVRAEGAHAPGLDLSTFKETVHSLDLGIRWLEDQQNADGSWSLAQHPALTALAVTAICRDPRLSAADPVPTSAQRGAEFLAACAQPDGGIYVGTDRGGGYPILNTALSMTALVLAGREPYEEVIRNAREFLVNVQHAGPDVFDGGFGYDASADRKYADLHSTFFCLEALWTEESSKPVDRPEGQPRSSLNWADALQFISRVQNRPESNDQAWAATSSPDDRGGFVYHPDESKAGEDAGEDGTRRMRSYGSMSYSGLLSFIYAGVDKSDPRVVAAVDWIRRHYTVDENPGMGQQGLYYNYHTMAKALTVWEEDPFALPDGRKAEWRRDLAGKLVSLQRIEPETSLGYWVNDNGRWWENNPVLTTSYALLVLEFVLPQDLG